MYVRLVSFSGGSADMRDSWAQTIRDTALPAMREQEASPVTSASWGKPITRSRASFFSTPKRMPKRPSEPCKNDAGK